MLRQDCLALGAIFAATDTVAVLQVIRPEEAGVLYSLVFGEGVMNDATSVAILRAVQVSALTNLWFEGLVPRPSCSQSVYQVSACDLCVTLLMYKNQATSAFEGF